jgi:hypothetical protein
MLGYLRKMSMVCSKVCSKGVCSKGICSKGVCSKEVCSKGVCSKKEFLRSVVGPR